MLTPTAIRIALLHAGTTQAAIARGLGVSRAAVGAVLHGKRRTARIRYAIATAVGLPAEAIWADPASVPGRHRRLRGRGQGRAGGDVTPPKSTAGPGAVKQFTRKCAEPRRPKPGADDPSTPETP